MSDEERPGALGDLATEARTAERLRAMAEYAELRNRWLLGQDRPGDRRRRATLRAILEGTGGIQHELIWPRSR